MRLQQWSRTDQVLLEGVLWAFPAIGAAAVLVEVAAGVRGDALEVSGPLPESLAPVGDGVTGPLWGTVSIEAPTVADRVWSLLPLLVAVCLAVVAARLLLGVVRELRHGDPFTVANARRLAVLALLVAVGGFGVQVLDNITQDVLLAAALPGVEDRPSAYELSFWPAPVSILVFFLAEVFARGARLREDVEGLV